MNLSNKAQEIYLEICKADTKLGDLRVIAQEIKKDQQLAEELWNTGNFNARLLAILIFDTKVLNADFIDRLLEDVDSHISDERLQLADWLMANQLTKDKKLVALIQSWQNNSLAIKRRLFWYHQGRLRWTGQTPPDNTQELLDAIEKNILKESPEVQWAMNFTAKWIGVFDKAFRKQCIELGERLGLYRDEVVAKNCSPEYLPMFIEQELKKRKL
jgi:3-methyladenine DNA glycosylase AlkD